jgi:hypothetical protein
MTAGLPLVEEVRHLAEHLVAEVPDLFVRPASRLRQEPKIAESCFAVSRPAETPFIGAVSAPLRTPPADFTGFPLALLGI